MNGASSPLPTKNNVGTIYSSIAVDSQEFNLSRQGPWAVRIIKWDQRNSFKKLFVEMKSGRIINYTVF